jgi:hypothetical protein
LERYSPLFALLKNADVHVEPMQQVTVRSVTRALTVLPKFMIVEGEIEGPFSCDRGGSLVALGILLRLNTGRGGFTSIATVVFMFAISIFTVADYDAAVGFEGTFLW